jgi:hypothetical protein
MNVEEPHEIRRFADGEPIPSGYVELTEEEFQELEKMGIAERGQWLRKNKERTFLGEMADALHTLDPEKERAEWGRRLRREQETLLRRQGAQSHAHGPAPPITPRDHRRQNR